MYHTTVTLKKGGSEPAALPHYREPFSGGYQKGGNGF